VSESFLEVFNRDIMAVLEADDIVFARSVLALLRQFLKVCYDFAVSLAETGDSSDGVPDFIVGGLGLELEEDDVSDHGNGIPGCSGIGKGLLIDRRKSRGNRGGSESIPCRDSRRNC
jgi:hypothetical protein